MKKMILILAAVLPLLLGCGMMEPTPYAALSFEEVEPIGKDGAELRLHVYSNYPWVMSCKNDKVSITPISGPAEVESTVLIVIPPVETEDMVTYYINCTVSSTSGDQFTDYPITIYQNYVSPDPADN